MYMSVQWPKQTEASCVGLSVQWSKQTEASCVYLSNGQNKQRLVVSICPMAKTNRG